MITAMRQRFQSLIRPPGLWATLFFAAFLLTGLLLHKDFGISWDEKVQRGTGAISVKYVLNLAAPEWVQAHPEVSHLPDLLTYQDRDYGVAFEVPLVIAEKAMGLPEDSADLFYLRHLLTFLFFFVALLFFYRLLRQRFDSVWWALAGTALLALSPRLFADSFYNCKDLPFLSAFTIALYFLFSFLEKRTVWQAVGFGFAAAFATDVRVIGILLPMACTGLFLWEWLFHGTLKKNLRNELRIFSTFVAAYLLFTVVMWPFLWSDPIGNFMYALGSMSKFRWDGKVFFMGELYNGNELPFYYLPVWIAITTPLLVLAGFLTGLFAAVRNLIQHKLKLYSDNGSRTDFGNLALLMVPVLAVVILGSTLYSGWRQLYFLYVPLVMLAMLGLKWAHERMAAFPRGKWIVPGLLGLQMAALLFTLWRMHPYGNVYFNVLGGGEPGARYEMDYWGLAYREGLEKTVAQDADSVLFLKVESYPGKVNETMLLAADQQRVHYVESVDSAEYYLGYKPLAGFEKAALIHEVKPAGLSILRVWKLR